MMKFCCGISLKNLGALLLAGCCFNSALAEDGRILTGSMAGSPTETRLASLIRSTDLLEQEAVFAPSGSKVALQESRYWAFDSEEADGPVLHLPAVVRLPPTSPQDSLARTNQDTLADEAIASLLPPRAIVAPSMPVDDNFSDFESLFTDESEELEKVADDGNGVNELSSEEQEIIDTVIRDSRSATTGVLTDARVNELAKSKIRRAYTIAGRGAYYAARQELIEVLRMISQSKDSQQGEAKQMLALAAGLRALEEAVDFAPRGTQLEADLAIDVICASHRTPVARHLKSTKILPRQMMDCYFRYAQIKLAMAVKGEPAGSMALHALGKLTSRLNRVEPERHRLAIRQAVAYQQAALLAHNQNHLAAHELAVLLADSGHYAEAEQLLMQVVPREPNAVVYRNLARVQEKLGQIEHAVANREYARQLVRQGASGQNNVQWVSPQQFARSGGNTARFASTMPGRQVAQPAARPQQFQTSNTNWR